MSVEFIDGVFFRGVKTAETLFVTYDGAANQMVISQEALDALDGPDPGEALDSLMYLLSDLRRESEKMEGGEAVRITKQIAVDARGRVIQQPKKDDKLRLSPRSLQIALENLLADINSGINDDTLLARFIDLRQRREEWTPVMNGIDGLLEVIEAKLRK